MRNEVGAVRDVSMGNADLMGCVKEQWEEAFLETSCLKAWEKTGIVPFTRCVDWQLKDTEEKGQAESMTGLNLQNFALNSVFGEAAPTFTAEQLQMVDPDGEMSWEEQLAEAHEVLNTRMSRAQLWFLEGGLTGEQAFQKVAEWQRKKTAGEG